MERIDSIELLSKRLSELHGLLFAFIDTLKELAESGLLKKSLIRREVEYDSADGDFRALIRALRYLGEKLEWLHDPHSKEAPPMPERSPSDGPDCYNPIAGFSYPRTGNRLNDRVMELTSALMQSDLLLFKLLQDSDSGRFRNESVYPGEDITRVLAGLAMDQMILVDLFCRLMFAVWLESEPDTGDDDVRALRNRSDIQERNMQWLTGHLKAGRGPRKKRRAKKHSLRRAS